MDAPSEPLCVNRDTSALLKLRDWLDQELVTSAPEQEVRDRRTMWRICSAT